MDAGDLSILNSVCTLDSGDPVILHYRLVLDSDHHRKSCWASFLDAEDPRRFDQAQASEAGEEFRLLLGARFSCQIVASG